jgi:hypothetical protein
MVECYWFKCPRTSSSALRSASLVTPMEKEMLEWCRLLLLPEGHLGLYILVWPIGLCPVGPHLQTLPDEDTFCAALPCELHWRVCQDCPVCWSRPCQVGKGAGKVHLPLTAGLEWNCLSSMIEGRKGTGRRDGSVGKVLIMQVREPKLRPPLPLRKARCPASVTPVPQRKR